jgi:hypothetical protein
VIPETTIIRRKGMSEALMSEDARVNNAMDMMSEGIDVRDYGVTE